MIYFTADTHFGHENIIKYCERPFGNISEMNAALVKNWNDIVTHEDTVYHLGDFTLKDIDWFILYVSRLNGNIKIVPGSHDWRWMKGFLYSGNRVEILPPLYSLELGHMDNKYPLVIVLCHYAMRVWDRSHYGSYHLYGHSHGNLPPLKNSLDVGVDVWNFAPISLDQVLEKLRS